VELWPEKLWQTLWRITHRWAARGEDYDQSDSENEKVESDEEDVEEEVSTDEDSGEILDQSNKTSTISEKRSP
jgi:hypothetical protein